MSSPKTPRRSTATATATATAAHPSSSPLVYPPSSDIERSSTPAIALTPRQSTSDHDHHPVSTASNIYTPARQTAAAINSLRAPRTPRTPLGRGNALFQSPAGRSMPSNITSASNSESDPGESTRVIWGTNITLQTAHDTFKEFLSKFKLRDRANPADVVDYDGVDQDEPYYPRLLRQMRNTGATELDLDAENLLAYNRTRKFHQQLINYPSEIIPVMDIILKDVMLDLALGDQDVDQDEVAAIEANVYKVRPFNLPSTHNMRDLNPNDIDKLVCVKGLVIRATPIIPDMKMAFFRCLVCNHTMTVHIDRGRIAEPTRCPRDVCNSLNTMSLIHNRSDFTDKQVIRLQETPDVVPDGQTPHTVSLCAYEELTDVCKAGDRVEVTGIFRSVPVRINPRQRTIKSLFKTFVDVLHVRKSDRKRVGVDASTLDHEADEQDETVHRVTPEEEARVKALSQKHNIYDILARSLAPSIYEMDDVKKGILLQLFGGTNKTFVKNGSPRYRGDINVLLVGDPGTSKSQILMYVHKIAPRGVYTSGKGSSAVGLTAYITRDPDTKQLVLESGALVLSDGGVCCIDEFDKMSDATRSILHEVMEQQTVSIAKAGIITTLNARTSILAAANPVGSRYNTNWPITRNIDLPPTLISRFDLLYLILDKIDETNDRRLARHLVNLYIEDTPMNGAGEDIEILPIETLTAYISYARTNLQPVMTEEAARTLVDSYVQLRSLGQDPRAAEKRVTATTRQLESMIRLSEAHARMRLSQTVEQFDVEEAGRLIREAMKESATDPTTGLIDLDLVQTGQGSHQRRMRVDLQREVMGVIDKMSGSNNKGLRWGDIIRELESQSSIPIDRDDFTNVMKELEAENLVRVAGERERRLVRRVGGSLIANAAERT